MIFDFKKPDYVSVFKNRALSIERIRSNYDQLPLLKQYYKENPAQFISDWGMTRDPKNVELGLPSNIPFILFDKQIEWVNFIMERWKNQEPGLTEKTRQMGMSWLSIALSCTLCIFYPGMAIGFGSRKEEYVDRIGDPKSLFQKAREFMGSLPLEFRAGWTLANNAPHMRIIFPETGASITGEAGDNIGRGDTKSLYFVDEAQPLSAKILTPDGWEIMADMKPGSIIFGQNGLTQKVTRVNDCGVHDVYRLTFSDGTSAECSPNHLWTVNRKWGKKETVTLKTHQIVDKLFYKSPMGQIQYLYSVDACNPIEFSIQKENFLLDPYLVGALLGDGHLSGSVTKITSADYEIIQSFKELLPEGIVIGAFDGRYTYNIIDPNGRGRKAGGFYGVSKVRTLMIAVGIHGKTGPYKFIPNAYKFSSIKNRLSLLQGLMDTDGSATGGSSSFYTSSRQLAEDVIFIVGSLGGKAHFNIKPDARGYRDQYALQISLPDGMRPFRLKRKLNKLRIRYNSLAKTIVAAEMIGRMPVRCISVENKNGLYITDNFIVTHNSSFLERPLLIDASLSQTTNCRQDISTPNGMGNPFAQKRFSGRVKVFTFSWRDDPRKDDVWYEKQLRELDPVVIAQEINIDYTASVEHTLIPSAWIQSAIDAHNKLNFKPTGHKLAALDVADEGADKNAICGAHGVIINHLAEWSGKNSDIFGTVQKAFNLCDEYGYTSLRYDSDGLGAGVRGDARVINDRRAIGKISVDAFRGSAAVYRPDAEDVKGRKNKDMFLNAKAQSWWSLRVRFQKTHLAVTGEVKEFKTDELISIPSFLGTKSKLISELSQPTYDINAAGKLFVDKAPSGTMSPNLADSVMIRFAPMAGIMRINPLQLSRI